MSFPTPEQLPALTAALIRLRGDTLGRIAEATGIRAANLSVWLRGKEQVISVKRLVGLLHHLGIEGTASLKAAYDTLLTLAEQAALDVGDIELLDGLLFRLSEDPACNVSTPRGWQRLEAALRTALAAGATPTSIAELLERHSRPESHTDSCSSARPD